MREPYMEVTYRRGRAVAAYYYLPRRPGQRSHRTVQAAPGVLVDFGRGGRPIGLEITAPSKVTLATLNSVLESLGMAPLDQAEYAPLAA